MIHSLHLDNLSFTVLFPPLLHCVSFSFLSSTSDYSVPPHIHGGHLCHHASQPARNALKFVRVEHKDSYVACIAGSDFPQSFYAKFSLVQLISPLSFLLLPHRVQFSLFG